MSSDGCQVQNIHRYIRKTYAKGRSPHDTDFYETDSNTQVEQPQQANLTMGISNSAGCSCGGDATNDGEIALILHKKCAVISLAEQQLHKLINETDRLFHETTTRSVQSFIQRCRQLLQKHHLKCQCALATFVGISFISGLLLGAASCGATLGRFDSPILTCIDSFFMPNTYTKLEDTFRCIT